VRARKKCDKGGRGVGWGGREMSDYQHHPERKFRCESPVPTRQEQRRKKKRGEAFLNL
jgi:hypothetical protein